MKKILSDYLRQIIANLEVDDTPTEDEIGDNSESNVRPPSNNLIKKLEKEKKVKKTNQLVNKDFTPTSKSKIKPPRKQHGFSEWDYTEKRRDYMQEYRNNGQDLSTGNRYVKKYKPTRG